MCKIQEHGMQAPSHRNYSHNNIHVWDKHSIKAIAPYHDIIKYMGRNFSESSFS